MTSPSPPAFELSVANGILVTPRGRRRANLYVRDGKVALITDQLLPVAERVDAKNLFVVPGMIDTHVHFMDPGASEREDFPSGTAAAAKAGVTTVIEHSHVFPVRNPVQLEAKVQYLATRSHVDFGLAAHSTPGTWQPPWLPGEQERRSSRSSPAPHMASPVITPQTYCAYSTNLPG